MFSGRWDAWFGSNSSASNSPLGASASRVVSSVVIPPRVVVERSDLVPPQLPPQPQEHAFISLGSPLAGSSTGVVISLVVPTDLSPPFLASLPSSNASIRRLHHPPRSSSILSYGIESPQALMPPVRQWTSHHLWRWCFSTHQRQHLLHPWVVGDILPRQSLRLPRAFIKQGPFAPLHPCVCDAPAAAQRRPALRWRSWIWS